MYVQLPPKLITVCNYRGGASFPQPRKCCGFFTRLSIPNWGAIYPQNGPAPVKLWITYTNVWIKRCSTIYFCARSKEVLYKTPTKGIIARICQNERSNHTHATALEPTGSVLALLQKLVVLFWSVAEQRDAQKLPSSQWPPATGRFFVRHLCYTGNTDVDQAFTISWPWGTAIPVQKRRCLPVSFVRGQIYRQPSP